jgi:two-component system sensor histidine kinase CpxA
VLIAVSDSSLAFGTLLDVKPMIWAVVISLLVSVIWWIPLVLGITRAMVKMVRATESIAEGRFETRVGVSRSDEIGRLGESIDQMAERLDSLVNGQRKFLGDVAHELGSPIGRLQLGTSILEERVPDKLRPAVADVREEVQEMSVLVGELLAFTKAEMRTAETELGVVNLSELVEKAIKREASERSVSVDVDSHLEVIADPALLLRSVGNVVRNAVRYAGENATLRVDARSLSTGRVRLTVSDSGPGVPDAALGRLGEPFFRPDLARTREMGGVGLGLSIVKSAVKSMGGTVKFSNADPQGFVVTFELASA